MAGSNGQSRIKVLFRVTLQNSLTIQISLTHCKKSTCCCGSSLAYKDFFCLLNGVIPSTCDKRMQRFKAHLRRTIV